MSKTVKIITTSVICMALAGVLAVLILLASVGREFSAHLKVQYPEASFKRGIVKVDIIHGNYYSMVTSLEDDTVFPIAKYFHSKDIYEDYPQAKSKKQYNSKIRDIFKDSDVENFVSSITGGGKIPFTDEASYEQINVYLTGSEDNVSTVKNILDILKEKDIHYERIGFTYEKDNGIYEVWLSSKDFLLSKEEIGLKVIKVK
jgi:hypothetical protein